MTRYKETVWTASDDPQLQRMLATHIHCGEAMQPMPPAEAAAAGPEENKESAAGTLTYRCACGFSFDEKAE